jgi:hypothetical protein
VILVGALVVVGGTFEVPVVVVVVVVVVGEQIWTLSRRFQSS